MIKPIYLYGSEVLRQKAADADITKKEEIDALGKDLWDTLGSAEGCGLAAPQIGVSLRVLIVDGREMTETYPYLDGVLFTDLVAPIRRKMISGKLQNITKGKVHPRYNSKLR